LKIRTVLTKKYLCWGTPEDFEDFLYYFNVRKSLIRIESNPSKLNGKVIILAAGSSERFKTSDNFPKQVELIFGRQLWEYSRDLSKSPSECILVTTKSLLEKLSSTKDFKDVISLDEPSSSQAHSARLGLESLQESEYPIHILASDSLINNVSGDKISNLLFDCDLVLWTSRNYPLGAMKPESYSWVTTNDDDVVQAFKYKDEPKSINSWKLITGNFTFKNSTIASQLVSEVIQNFGPYPSLDLVIEIALSKGMAIRTVDVPYFMTVGTQEEGAIIKYWTDLEFGQ
jgi:choline kinase